MAEVERLFDEVREVLLREWDPIGVGHNPECRDEYDRYARTLCRYLKEGADEYRLAAYLARAGAGAMGLSFVATDCDAAVARRLLSFRVRWPGQKGASQQAMSRMIASGEIIAFGPGYRAIVWLTDGTEVTAVLALRSLRARHGCLFGDLVGSRVTVELRDHPRPARVVKIEAQST
jgi:hypothetical protein